MSSSDTETAVLRVGTAAYSTVFVERTVVDMIGGVEAMVAEAKGNVSPAGDISIS